jgi:hypothetical protein
MTDEKDLVTVVDRTALIENLLNQVIVDYCAPDKERFMLFWNVVLDSSVMSIGAKVKVSMAIAQEVDFKLSQNAIHNVMALRNAFAHHKTDSHPVLVAGKTREEDSVHYELLIISNSGRISRKRRQDALVEFNANYTAAKDSLVTLLNIIRAGKKNDAV